MDEGNWLTARGRHKLCWSWDSSEGSPVALFVTSSALLTAKQIIGSNGEPHSLDVWNFVLGINLTGTFNLTRIACKYLVKVPPEGPDGERGLVIMVASSAAVRPRVVPHCPADIILVVSQFEGQPGQAAYAATKGALVSMTLPMARDLERFGVRVVTIAPGAFITPMTNIMTKKTQASISRDLLFPRRMGEPHEFAQTVKWILECPYINGETIRLSGGSRLPGKL